MSKTTRISTRCLCESAILLALATILSEIKVIHIPFGGGITFCAMVPMILLAYRRSEEHTSELQSLYS